MQAKLMEMAVLATLIGNIGRQRVEFDIAVQQAACEVIGQSVVHRNITPARQLLDVIGAHLKPVIVAHFEKFGNIVWSRAEKKLVFHANLMSGADLEWTDEYRATVLNTLWMKAKKEVEPKSSFDVAEETDKFLERMLKANKRGADLKHGELLKRITDTYNRYQAETYLAGTTALPTVADVKEGASPEKLQQLQEQFGGKPSAVTGSKAVPSESGYTKHHAVAAK